MGLGLRLPLGVELRNSWRIFGVAARDVDEMYPGPISYRVFRETGPRTVISFTTEFKSFGIDDTAPLWALAGVEVQISVQFLRRYRAMTARRKKSQKQNENLAKIRAI